MPEESFETSGSTEVKPGIFIPPDQGAGFASAYAELAEFSWAIRSHPGAVRPDNEDFVGAYTSSAADATGPLFVAADGMGGHAAGEVASRMAVETVLQAWTRGGAGPPNQMLRTAVRAANAAVFSASLDPGRGGMGTTLTALTLAGREAFIAHVGDSRAYLVRERQCLQLTVDHSRVAEMLRMRLITPEQAATHPARSMLTRSLGAAPGVQIDISRTDVARGDIFVICSDGLWGLVSRAEIAEATASLAANEAAQALVEIALKRGAPDNVTVVIISVTSDIAAPAAYTRRGRRFFSWGR